MALRDQPYIPLYVQDIMTDEKLNECSASTHGIYIKGIMCLMHKSEQYGIILLKQKDKQTTNQNKNFAYKLVKHLPYSVDEIKKAIDELLSEEVLFIDGDKLCQKRMIKDNLLSIERAKAGKTGGLKTQFAKAKVKPKEKANSEDENVFEIESNNNVGFEDFWNGYDKKVDRAKCLPKWKRLTQADRVSIMEILPTYLKANPDIKYRKNPATFLNNRSWEDVEGINQQIKSDKPKEKQPYKMPGDYLKSEHFKERQSNSGPKKLSELIKK